MNHRFKREMQTPPARITNLATKHACGVGATRFEFTKTRIKMTQATHQQCWRPSGQCSKTNQSYEKLIRTYRTSKMRQGTRVLWRGLGHGTLRFRGGMNSNNTCHLSPRERCSGYIIVKQSKHQWEYERKSTYHKSPRERCCG